MRFKLFNGAFLSLILNGMVSFYTYGVNSVARTMLIDKTGFKKASQRNGTVYPMH